MPRWRLSFGEGSACLQRSSAVAFLTQNTQSESFRVIYINVILCLGCQAVRQSLVSKEYIVYAAVLHGSNSSQLSFELKMSIREDENQVYPEYIIWYRRVYNIE